MTTRHPGAPSSDRRLILFGTSRTIPELSAMVAPERPANLRALIDAVVVIDAQSVNAVAASHADPVADVRVLRGIEQFAREFAQGAHATALISLPAALRSESDRVIAELKRLNITWRCVTPIEDVLAGGTNAAAASPVSSFPLDLDPLQLIGRSPRAVDQNAVRSVIQGKRVLITGAGGSIGSELALVAAAFRPAALALMDRSENALFEIDRRVSELFPDVPRRAMLHDVADEDETMRLACTFSPHSVFHAAAHKHVPLMEDHPAHAVRNNVFGTRAIADAAAASGAERFVMISTDKAVNPVSVMGQTKRLAEIYVQTFAQSGMAGACRMSMVRFGNVLGSASSVLSIWTSQLVRGGPLTITDHRMTRYFMTIPEAAALVLESASIDSSRGGEVFVLDMGEPVSIVELACRFALAHRRLPRLAESAPADAALRAMIARYADQAPDHPAIDITFTGARPGEKLHEQLAYAAEHLAPAGRPGISVWRPVQVEDGASQTWRTINETLAQLESIISRRDPAAVAKFLRACLDESAAASHRAAA